ERRVGLPAGGDAGQNLAARRVDEARLGALAVGFDQRGAIVEHQHLMPALGAGQSVGALALRQIDSHHRIASRHIEHAANGIDLCVIPTAIGARNLVGRYISCYNYSERDMNDILEEHGDLFLGSRLNRLAARFQSEAAKIIRASGFAIQPAQFPMLAAIHRHGPLTVGKAAEVLGVSQPVVTRTLGSLLDMGLLTTTPDDSDLRQKTIPLTSPGYNQPPTARR
ncbi:hypothetical protein E4T56_gene7984, partial [Termitomyces sp. T112]